MMPRARNGTSQHSLYPLYSCLCMTVCLDIAPARPTLLLLPAHVPGHRLARLNAASSLLIVSPIPPRGNRPPPLPLVAAVSRRAAAPPPLLSAAVPACSAAVAAAGVSASTVDGAKVTPRAEKRTGVRSGPATARGAERVVAVTHCRTLARPPRHHPAV